MTINPPDYLRDPDPTPERDLDGVTIAYLYRRLDRAVAERDRLRTIVTEAALESYTPDGSEGFVAEFHRVLAERDDLRANRIEAEAKVARVEAVMAHWEQYGLNCECGHDLGLHNGMGCYARLAYQPVLVTCPCELGDDRHESDFAVRDLHRALHGQEPTDPDPTPTTPRLWVTDDGVGNVGIFYGDNVVAYPWNGTTRAGWDTLVVLVRRAG